MKISVMYSTFLICWDKNRKVVIFLKFSGQYSHQNLLKDVFGYEKNFLKKLDSRLFFNYLLLIYFYAKRKKIKFLKLHI